MTGIVGNAVRTEHAIVKPSISGISMSDTSKSTAPSKLCTSSRASIPFSASIVSKPSPCSTDVIRVLTKGSSSATNESLLGIQFVTMFPLMQEGTVAERTPQRKRKRVNFFGASEFRSHGCGMKPPSGKCGRLPYAMAFGTYCLRRMAWVDTALYPACLQARTLVLALRKIDSPQSEAVRLRVLNLPLEPNTRHAPQNHNTITKLNLAQILSAIVLCR
jgi:hypothetical protein